MKMHKPECKYPPVRYFKDVTGEYVANPHWNKCTCVHKEKGKRVPGANEKAFADGAYEVGVKVKESKRHKHSRKDRVREARLKSPEWKIIVGIVRERDHWMCVECSEEKNLSTHHIDFTKYNDELDNLVTLCWTCHRIKHMRQALLNRERKHAEEALINAINQEKA